MAGEPNEKKPGEKKPGLFRRIVGSPWRLSQAGLVSWLTAFALLAIVITVWSFFFGLDDNVHGALGWPRMLAVLALVVIIPLVLYRGLRLWLEGESSRFPDIDYAWNAGLEALHTHGLSLEHSPIFLVLGSSGERRERFLMMAAGQDFRVRGVPEGKAPLHWYADPDGIFIFCTDASWLSALTVLAEKKPIDPVGLRTVSFNAGSQTRESVPQAPAPAAMPPMSSVPEPSEKIRGTVMLDQFLGQSAVSQGAAPPNSAAARPAGTLVGADFGTFTKPELAEPSVSHMPAANDPQVMLATVPPLEATSQLQRLQYVGQLLRNARRPVCPLNGILTLLPFQMMQAEPTEVEELERAIKSDLLTVQRTLQVRCPVTSMIVGLDQERGFSELVRRVGPERAASQRFGQRYDVRCLAERDGLAAFCDHVCGTFEDWVHALFREQQALSRPGNTRLYGLLCKVRCNLKTRLTEILTGAFGYDSRELPNDDPFLFSGCYFAATGESPDRQAFVKGVIDKLVQEQDYVEWSQHAMAANRRSRWLAIGGFLCSSLLLLCLAVMVVFQIGL